MSEKKVKQERKELEQSRQICEHCAFYMEQDAQIGHCRRYPPMGAFGQGPEGQLAVVGSGFPPVKHDHWCGEWQKGSLIKVARGLNGRIPTNLN